MRIGIVSLVRNEADVLPAFLSHLAALVDDAVLMDHGSVDGSAALLAVACGAQPGWAAWRVAVPGYHQALFCGFAARHLFRAGVDQVLFLDADEFIDLPDRSALDAALARMDQPGDIGVWSWRDCVPDRLGGALGFGDALWQAPEASRYPKVVLSRALFAASGGRAAPVVGAHFVRDAGVATRDVPLGTVLHVPLRSAEQMRRKLVLGSLAELARSDRSATDARHWAEGLERVAAAPVDDDDVRGMAARYGEPGAAWERIGPDGLAAQGFSLRALTVAHAAVPAVPPSVPVEPWQVMADALRGWKPASSAGLSLEVVDGVLRQSASALWRDPFLAGTPLLDLARKAIAPGSRTLVIGLDPAVLGAGALADAAAGPFDAAVVQDLTVARVAAAHAALRAGGMLVAEAAGSVADPAMVDVVADCLAPGYGPPGAAPVPAAADPEAALEGLFQVEQRVRLPGAVLHPVLAGLGGRFDWADPRDATAGRLAARLDKLLTQHGVVPPGRVAVVARRVR